MDQVGQQPKSPTEPLSLVPPATPPPPLTEESKNNFPSNFAPLKVERKADVDDLQCETCGKKKRYETMSWWWDEKCLKILCEHCGTKEHRTHPLKVHGDAERCHNDEYGKFVETVRSKVSGKLASLSESQKFSDLSESFINDVARYQSVNESLIGSLETTIKAINHEMSSLGGVRLNHSTFNKRKVHRDTVSKIAETVNDMLHELKIQSKDLFAQMEKLNERASDLEKLERSIY